MFIFNINCGPLIEAEKAPLYCVVNNLIYMENLFVGLCKKLPGEEVQNEIIFVNMYSHRGPELGRTLA
jgi:hypothetical protein